MNGWKVLDLETEDLSVSRDVVFYEEYFSFAQQKDPHMMIETPFLC